jgi:acyl carrier protein
MDATMRLEEMVALVLGVPAGEVGEDTAPATTDTWTSLAHVQIVVAVEDVYGVTLSAAEIKGSTSVRELRRILEAKGIAPAAQAGPGS